MQAPQGFCTLEDLTALPVSWPGRAGDHNPFAGAPVGHVIPGELAGLDGEYEPDVYDLDGPDEYEDDGPEAPVIQAVSFADLLNGVETLQQARIAAETFARYLRNMEGYGYEFDRLEDGYIYVVPPESRPLATDEPAPEFQPQERPPGKHRRTTVGYLA